MPAVLLDRRITLHFLDPRWQLGRGGAGVLREPMGLMQAYSDLDLAAGSSHPEQYMFDVFKLSYRKCICYCYRLLAPQDGRWAVSA